MRLTGLGRTFGGNVFAAGRTMPAPRATEAAIWKACDPGRRVAAERDGRAKESDLTAADALHASRSPRSRTVARFLRVDVEAEHHAALVVLGDVAMRHPPSRIRDFEQDVDRLAGRDQHGVFPY